MSKALTLLFALFICSHWCAQDMDSLMLEMNGTKSGCHDAKTKAEGVDLSSYAGIMQNVKAGKPSSSKLIEVLSSSGEKLRPPPPDNKLSQQQIDLLSRWISDGALNSTCSQAASSCTSTASSFSMDISPILITNCNGCQSGNTISGGVNLSNYAGVKSVATSGKLYNSISQNGSAVPMPPSLKLSVCDIKKIKLWVDAGSAND